MTRWTVPLILATLLAAAFPHAARAQNADGVDRLLQPAPPVAAVPNPLGPMGGAPFPAPQGGQSPQPQYQPQGAQTGSFQQNFNGFPQGQGSPVPTSAASGATSGQNARDAQFQRALREALPMSPGEVTQYRRESDRVQRATVGPLSPARPHHALGAPVAQARRADPPPCASCQGSATTLTFSDITGAPWPVLSVVTGNPTAYQTLSAGEEGKTNIIVVSPIKEHIPSNLVVTLVGHPVPIVMAIDPEGADVDYRVDVGILHRGPNAAQDVVGVSNLSTTNDLTMVKFLDGVAPEGAKAVRTSSPEVEAWRFEDVLYIRTRGDVLSPSYTARTSNVSACTSSPWPSRPW